MNLQQVKKVKEKSNKSKKGQFDMKCLPVNQ